VRLSAPVSKTRRRWRKLQLRNNTNDVALLADKRGRGGAALKSLQDFTAQLEIITRLPGVVQNIFAFPLD
jgi:hypothetical protein